MARSLKTARSLSFLIHAGYLLMLVLLALTNKIVLAFGGILLALVGFFLTHQAAKCPKCTHGLLDGGNGLNGVLTMLSLTAGRPISCKSCGYETVAGDYA